MTITFKDLNSAVKYHAKELLNSSSIDSTNDKNFERYKNSLGGEIIQEYFKISNPTQIISTWDNHQSYKWWMYSEILSEFLNIDPPLMYKYKPELFEQHYDLLEDGRMQYTYSGRFTEFNQLVNVYKKLKDNPNSKRAVIDIFTPYDTAPDREDTPCTTMYHFIHRDGKLNMSVFMRSWDFFGGYKTYDFALSSFVLQSFASWLNMEVGELGFYVNSLHYYNRDRDNLEKLVQETQFTQKNSDVLVLNEKIDISEFHRQLRMVKNVEEAAFNGNYTKAHQIKNELEVELFKDMSDCYINKNLKIKNE